MIVTLYPTFRRWSEGGSVFFVSDTHFEDPDCKLMDPQWPQPEEHIAKIRKKVHRNDTLIHLGDVGNPEYMRLIPGYKVLLLGNHDQSAAKIENYFDEIYTGPLFVAEKILLSHEPIDLPFALNIHGHDHNPEHKGDERHVNCCANVVDFDVLSLKDLIKAGALSGISSIHRQTIDTATERKNSQTGL